MANVLAPISVGELLDKITTLEIKKDHAQDPIKLANIDTELNELNALAKHLGDDALEDLFGKLKRVNQVIWLVEDQIRIKERNREFDAAFVQLAREVYINNDLRAEIKREINIATKSYIIEEKIY